MVKFGSTNLYREAGQVFEAIVVSNGVKDAEGRLDLAFFKQLISADGKTPVNVVGSSRQAEMVQFRHDVLPGTGDGHYEAVEDWFFGLSDEHLEPLLVERKRRQDEAASAKAGAEGEQARQAQLAGVKIRPSDRVLNLAARLWIRSLEQAGHAGEHDQVDLPDYEKQPELWQPWIEQAKEQLATKQAEPKSSQGYAGNATSNAPGLSVVQQRGSVSGTQPVPGGDAGEDPTSGSGGSVQ